MGLEPKVIDIDLDVLNYARNEMPDSESIVFVRAREEGDDHIDTIHSVTGNLDVLVNAFIGVEDLQDVIMFSAAYLIKEKKLDIKDYMEQIL